MQKLAFCIALLLTLSFASAAFATAAAITVIYPTAAPENTQATDSAQPAEIPATSAPETIDGPKDIVITFTGDCTLGIDDRERGRSTSFDAYIEKYGLAYPFEKVRYIFEQDDLTVINLEGTFYNYDANRAQKTYAFRGPTDYVNMLTMSSIEAAYLGNNHSLDYGDTGLNTTIETLENANVAWFGSTDYCNKAFIYEKYGVKIGFVSLYTSFWYYDNGVNQPKVNRLFDELKAANCDLIIACTHAGVEYDVLHDLNQEKLAEAMIRRGADIIVNNHPHTVQGIRIQDGRTILWSLGNFSFGGNSKLKNTHANTLNIGTYIAQFTFSFDENNKYLGHTLNIIPCHFSGTTEYNDYQPYPVTGAEAEAVIKSIQKDSQGLKLNPYVEGVGAVQNFVPAPVK